MKRREVTHLVVHVKRDGICTFRPLLRQGVRLEEQVGCTVGEFLTHQMGLSPEYVEERIQTIFLDGRPVDDITTAVIGHGSTLSLSAAMPGLAGAALRRGGFFAPMRFQISLGKGLQPAVKEKGRVTLKLFNAVAEDLASPLLGRGVYVEGEVVGRFLGKQTDEFWAECDRITLNGIPVGKDDLVGSEWENADVFLQVRPAST